MSGFELLMPPKTVGWYRLGPAGYCCYKFALTKKPCWFHRTMMRIFLGWVWEDSHD